MSFFRHIMFNKINIELNVANFRCFDINIYMCYNVDVTSEFSHIKISKNAELTTLLRLYLCVDVSVAGAVDVTIVLVTRLQLCVVP